MKVQTSDQIPPNKCALIRDGSLVWLGVISKLSALYRPGDILCVNTESYMAIRAAIGLASKADPA